jgi:transposase
VVGVVGRGSGQLRLRVAHRPWAAETVGFAVPQTKPGAAVYTDDWSPYKWLPRYGRRHAAVSHVQYEWARDDDGDGVREVHCNTLEGIWTGLRNFLRPFRGVNKIYLQQYVAMFEWSHNIKTATDDFLRVLLSRRRTTGRGAIRKLTTRSGT